MQKWKVQIPLTESKHDLNHFYYSSSRRCAFNEKGFLIVAKMKRFFFHPLFNPLTIYSCSEIFSFQRNKLYLCNQTNFKKEDSIVWNFLFWSNMKYQYFRILSVITLDVELFSFNLNIKENLETTKIKFCQPDKSLILVSKLVRKCTNF